MVHFVKIQGNITDPAQLYKRTEKKDGVKTTTVFQRDASSQPKNIGEKILQKMTDLFSGVKKAKNSVTLLKAAQDLQNSGCIDKSYNLTTQNKSNKSIRLNTNFLTNIANDPKMKPSGQTLGELQGSKFHVS
jgi:hypothetical protein